MAAQTTAWVNFNGKDVGVKITIDGINDKINNLGKKGKKNIDSLSASFKNLKSQISSMSGSMGSLPLIGGLGAAGIFAGGKTAVEKFAGRESIETAIGMFSKTEEKTASNLAFLKKTSRELGIVYDTAADGYKRLMQNLSSTNMPMEEQNALFKKISTVIRVSNVDNTAAESVYRAFGDMFSKGGIQAQELKTQLANAIGGVMPAMKQAFPGKNIAAGLDAGAFNKQAHVVKLINQLYENNEKGLDKATKQTSYKLAIIQDDWGNAMASIGNSIVDSGALGVVSDMASELSIWVDANKDLIKQSLKGGVDFVKKGFEWAVAHKTEIGSILSNMTKFIGVVTATNLVVAFSDPMRLAALAVGGMAVAIWNAVEKMKEVRSEETKLKQNKPFKFYESAMAGVSNVGFGFGNAIAGNYKAPVFSQILGGAAQIVMSVPQAAAEGINWVRRDAGDGKPITGIGKLGELMGSASLGIDKYTRPEDYAPNNESVLRNEVLNLNTSKAAQEASARESERVSVDTISTAVMKGIEMGMYGVTINVDADGRKTMQFAGAKGPGINVEKN